MVERELYGSISACRFSVDSYINVVDISMDGEVQIICQFVFFSLHLELKVFIYAICLIYNCLLTCFVLVEDDQNIIHVSLDIQFPYFLTTVLYSMCFFQKL